MSNCTLFDEADISLFKDQQQENQHAQVSPH
jgi:hypothetical protein